MRKGKIEANNLILTDVIWHEVMELVEELEVNQFSAVSDEDRNYYTLTFPINSVIADKYRAEIHMARAHAVKKDRPTDPDDKPPRPTNPRGSGGKVAKFENTLAIAA